MKIGIDAHAAENDGSGNCTYIRNVLGKLREIDTRNHYVLYVTNSRHPFYRDFPSYENFKIKQLPAKNPLIRIPIVLARETLKDNLDILHVQYIAPPFHRGKLVATIHDLGFLHVPESFSKIEVLRSKILIRMTAKRSDKIITGSNFSKNDIAATYRIDPQHIAVISHGVSSAFKPENDVSKSQKILAKYGIDKPYILCVGRLNPRKNLTALVEAFTRIKNEKSIPHKLVIAGKEDYATRKIIQSIEAADSSSDVILTGFVEDDDLPALYSGADVFLYPSLFEGVGLPVLEAMSCGVPVIASRTSSLQEIVAEAGITVDPTRVDELAQAISSLLLDSGLREEYKKKGFLNVQGFSWKHHARETLKIYEDLSPP